MAWRRGPTIRKQLLLLVLALGVPFVGFLLVSAAQQADADRLQAGHGMLAAARLAAARLDDHVGDIQQVLAVLGAVVGSTPSDAAGNQTLLRNLAPRLPPQVSRLGVWTVQGQNIGSLEPGDAGDVAAHAVFRQALAAPGLAAEAPVRLPGAVAASAGVSASASAATAASASRPVALFALRFERGGTTAGVVTLMADLESLQLLLTPPGTLPNGAVVSVTQQRAIVVARSQDPGSWIGRDLHATVPDIDQAQRKRQGVRDGASADGVVRISGFATAQRVPWLVYVGVPLHVALAAVHWHVVESLAVGAALLVAGLLLSAWMARRISQPLQALCVDAQTLAAGELSHRSTVRAGGEVGELAATLNQMADALGQRNSLLLASEAELADLYDNAPCGFHSLDSDGRFLRINNTALRWLGYQRDELLGRPLVDLMTPEGQLVYAEKFPQLAQTGCVKDVEFDLRCKTGEYRRVVASANAVRDADGSYLRCRAAWYDITELQGLRSDLQRLEGEKQALLDTELIGFMKLQDRRIAWANPGMTSLLGYSQQELLGQSTRLLYADDDSYVAKGAQVYARINIGLTCRLQLQLKRKDGAVVWFDLLGVPLPHEPGAAMVVLVDLSPVKDAENARMRAMALQAENRQLIESNRVKTLFLANMSHELHTPLNAVLGYTHLLRSGKTKPDSPKFSGFLDQIDTSGRQLLALVDAMLTLARLEAGKLDFKPEPVQLQRLLADAVQLQQVEASAKGIRVTLEVDDTVGEVVVDPLRLTQVVVIYLSNAIKFSATGTAVVVRALVVEPGPANDAARFRVEVQDHGIGIAERDLPRLFRAFHQLSEGASRAYGGAGLGLALACHLVEGQGGQVAVRSTLGQGSTFSVTLTLRPAA